MNDPDDAGLSHSPYPGLRPFRRDEADIFFGREEQIDQLLGKLESCRFLSVVGTSGCGKSSLVRAGMLAALEGGFMASAGPRWHVAEMRPGSQPLINLTRALLESGLLRQEWSQDDQGQAFLLATMRRGPLGLVEALRESGVPARTSLLLLVDQFEEIFRFHKFGDSNEATAFVDLLLASARQQEMPIYVVVTMRSDFLGDCSLFAGLPEALNEGQFLTPRLSRDQCRASVVGPAAAFDCEVEPALVNRVLNDMGTDADQLPLMQHAMMRVWMRAQAAQGAGRSTEGEPVVLTLADYEAIGGLREALSKHADEAFDELDADARRVAEVMFRCLSERGADQRDIRRPVRVDTVAAVAGVQVDRVRQIAEVFRRADCSFLTPPAGTPLTAETVLDISHESLIRQWKQLARWVGDEADSASIYRRLVETARLWIAGKAAVWGTPDLENALVWREREHLTAAWAERYGGDFELSMRFLDASQTAREQQIRGDELRQQREMELLQQMAETQKQRADESEMRRTEQLAANARLRFRAVVAMGSGAVAVLLALVAFGLLFDSQQARRSAVAARDEARMAQVEAQQLADQERQSREREAAERQKAVASQREAFEKTLSANDSLAQAAIAQARSLTTARQTGRQAAALKVLEQAGSTHRDMQRLLQSLPQDFQEQATQTAGRWREYLPQLRTEAVGWMLRSSLQDLKILSYSGMFGQFTPVGFNPEGSVLVRYDREQIQSIDANTGEVKAVVKLSASCSPQALAFSKDGTRLLLVNLQLAAASPVQIEFRTFPDLKVDRTARMDLDDKQSFNGQFFNWVGNDAQFLVCPDLHFLIGATSAGTSIWDADTGRKLQFIPKFRATSINRSGNTLIGRSPSGGIWFVDIESGRTLRELTPESKVTSAWISPDSNWLVVEAKDKNGWAANFEVLNAETGKSQFKSISEQIRMNSGDENGRPLGTVAFHPDGSRFLACDQQRMYVVSLRDGTVTFNSPHPDPAAASGSGAASQLCFPDRAEFSTNGSTIISCLRFWDAGILSERIVLWDLSVPKTQLQIANAAAVPNGLSFDDRGRVVAGTRIGVVNCDLFNAGAGWSTPEARYSYYQGGKSQSGITPSGGHYLQFTPGKISFWEFTSGRRVATFESSMPGQIDGGNLPARNDLGWALVKQRDEIGDSIALVRTDALEQAPQTVARMTEFGTTVPNLMISDDGRFLAFYCWSQSEGHTGLKVVRTSDGQVVCEIKTPQNQNFQGVLFAQAADRVLAYGNADGKEMIRLIDLANGKSVGELSGIDSGIYNMRLCADGNHVVLQNWNRAAKPPTVSVDVWSPGQEKKTFVSGAEQIDFQDFNADGTRLAVVHSKKKPDSNAEREFTAELWNTVNGDKLCTRPYSSQPTVMLGQQPTLALSVPAALKSTGLAELWRLDNGEVIRSWNDSIQAQSPDGRYLLLSQGSVIERNTGEICMDTQDSPQIATFSSDSRFLLTRRSNSHIHIWNLANHSDVIVPAMGQLYFASEDLSRIATYDAAKGLIRIWEGATGKLAHEVPNLLENSSDGAAAATLDGLEFSKDGRHVVLSGRQQIRLVALADAKQQRTLPRANHVGSVGAVSFSPDGRVVASAGDDQTVCFWDAASNGKYLGMLESGSAAQCRAAFADDGVHLVTRDGAGECVFWRWELAGSGDERHVKCTSLWKNADAAGEIAAIARGSAAIALGDADGTLRILEAKSGNLLRLLKPAGKASPVRAIAFSDSGQGLAVANDDGAIGHWSLDSSEPVRQWVASWGTISSLAFAPHRNLLVSGGSDLRFWNPHTGEPVMTIDKRDVRVLAVAFDSTGDFLASAAEDKTVTLTNMREISLELDKLGLGWNQDGTRAAKAAEPADARRGNQTIGWREATESELREYVDLNRHRAGARQCEAAKDWQGAVSHLDRLLIVEPEGSDLYQRRGAAHAELSQWADAARDFREAVGRNPDNSWLHICHGVAALRAGQSDICQDEFRALPARFLTNDNSAIRSWAVWGSVLLPDLAPDTTELVKTAQSLVDADLTVSVEHQNFAAALYRAGRFDEALPQLHRALRLDLDGMFTKSIRWMLQAMCEYRLGKTEESRGTLKRATDWIDAANAGTVPLGELETAPNAFDWLTRQHLALLRHEAEGLILGNAGGAGTP